MQSSMQKSRKIPRSWKISSTLALSLSLLGATCHQAPPAWDGKIWAGDSATESIQRAQEHEAISCSDLAFNDYLCISGPDFQKFYETYVLGCEKWKDGITRMSAKQAYSRILEMRRLKISSGNEIGGTAAIPPQGSRQ